MSPAPVGEPLERRAVISGIGQSQIGRRLGRSDLDLTVEAALAAMADAGLRREDIDGLSTYPGMGSGTPGFAGPTTPEVQDALGLSLNWHDGGGEGAGQMRAVIAASLAVAAGLARHVLVYRTVTEGTAQGAGGRQGIGGMGGSGRGVPRFGGFLQWSLPYGAVSAANWIAMVGQRRMHEFGLTREQLGQIALNGRRNAALNPNAIYTDPMSMDDYLAARMISTPLCLFDCDAPCDGSTAVVVSHRDVADDLDHPAVQINAVGHGPARPPQLGPVRRHDHHGGPRRRRLHVGAHRTRPGRRRHGAALRRLLRPGHRVARGPRVLRAGESGPFIEGGGAIARDGVLPLNTAGGQLSGGRLHGFGLIHEACVQLRGEGGARQVVRPHGRGPEVAAVANGGGPIAGTMLLTRGVR